MIIFYVLGCPAFEEVARLATRGELVTLSGDGWDNRKKEHVVGFQIANREKVHTVGVEHVADHLKRDGALFLSMLQKMHERVSRDWNAEVIAVCTDQGPDCRSARKMFVLENPQIANVDCLAHQIANVAKDYYKKNTPLLQIKLQALLLITFFLNHRRARGLLDIEALRLLGIAYVLLAPNTTRWTSMFLAHARLLQLERAIRSLCAGSADLLRDCVDQTSATAKANVEVVIELGTNNAFWIGIAEMTEDERMFAIAINVAQAGSTRTDHVTLIFATLFVHFLNLSETLESGSYRQTACVAVTASLERRWSQMEIDIFLISLFLSPIPGRERYCFACSCRATRRNNLFVMIERLYKRFFRVSEVPPELFSNFADYVDNRGDFSNAQMLLEQYLAEARRQQIPVDPLQLWKGLTDAHNKDVSPLAKLAIRLLSIVPNSAGLERLFSQMGLIHNSKANWFDFEKVGEIAKLKAYLKNLRDGGQRRLKRNFGGEPIPKEFNSQSYRLSYPGMDASDFRMTAEMLEEETQKIIRGVYDEEEPQESADLNVDRELNKPTLREIFVRCPNVLSGDFSGLSDKDPQQLIISGEAYDLGVTNLATESVLLEELMNYLSQDSVVGEEEVKGKAKAKA